MAERDIRSEYALAQLLGTVSGKSAETARKAIQRWRQHNRQPGQVWRESLAEVLGGQPGDYIAERSEPTPIRRPREEDLDVLRAEVLGDLADLAEDFPLLVERLVRLEAQVAQLVDERRLRPGRPAQNGK